MRPDPVICPAKTLYPAISWQPLSFSGMRQTDVDALLSASWHFALVVVGVEVVWGNLDL